MSFVRLFILAIVCFSTTLHSWVEWRNGGWAFTSENAKYDAEVHFNTACEAFNCGNWAEAAVHFRVITCNYADTDMGPIAAFYLGISEFNMCEYELANNALNCYLKYRKDSTHFFEAIQYKFAIADFYKDGGKRRLFSYAHFPKWGTGYTYAIEIYDQIIFAVPNNELAAKSLYHKADLLAYLGSFREAVDTYQIFLRRFSKHELVPQCYLNILHCYSKMAEIESQNADILAFAQLNLAKFAKLYPRDERLGEAQAMYQQIKEQFAYSYYELGCYYERSGWCRAAAIYYNTCQQRFPDTQVAGYSAERLQYVGHLLPPEPAKKEEPKEEVSIDNSIPKDIEFD